jgi:signal transduction histidine kinase
VRLSEEENAAMLTVRDTGQGIDPALLTELFTMFFQTDAPTKAKSGLGVGLGLAKVLVEMHGTRGRSLKSKKKPVTMPSVLGPPNHT